MAWSGGERRRAVLRVLCMGRSLWAGIPLVSETCWACTRREGGGSKRAQSAKGERPGFVLRLKGSRAHGCPCPAGAASPFCTPSLLENMESRKAPQTPPPRLKRQPPLEAMQFWKASRPLTWQRTRRVKKAVLVASAGGSRGTGSLCLTAVGIPAARDHFLGDERLHSQAACMGSGAKTSAECPSQMRAHVSLGGALAV
jgi:hypothetical protein